MKKTLREFAEGMKKILPGTEWATYDGHDVCFFAGARPRFDQGKWHGFLLGELHVEKSLVDVKDLNVSQVVGGRNRNIWRHAIFGFSEFMTKLEKETQKKSAKTFRKHPVLAYFADGTTVLFNTYEECKEFFGLKRIETVKRYIETGNTLPDGSTTLDEVPDEKFLDTLFGY